ncbi:hypothetical protein AVEN_200591-1 [Araneus ventricosus]|uniref:Uncharacterized protein n=1 Tax=Araneus ventricosus TaxID=182803 RepID=A0A4Y2UMX2_ARAVE|nr:hypothetical protein AVEN_200591-1 [Araneus ventricosus]
MNNKEEISVQHRFNIANEMPQKVTKIIFQYSTLFNESNSSTRSCPDLIQCGFFLWDYLKFKVYRQRSSSPPPPTTNPHFRTNSKKTYRECMVEKCLFYFVQKWGWGGGGGEEATHDEISKRHNLSIKKQIVEIRQVVVAGELSKGFSP